MLVIAAASAHTGAAATFSGTGGSRSGALGFCNADADLTAAQKDKLWRLADQVRQALRASDAPAALVSRSGLALQRLGIQHSHAGISLRDSPEAPYTVRQLYYDCDQHRPRIFDQGLSAFITGAQEGGTAADDPDRARVAIVLLPADAAHALASSARHNAQALALLGGTYSANAHAYSTLYQNCNQWVAELMGVAWSTSASVEVAPPPAAATRQAAQQHLSTLRYAPATVPLRWWMRPLAPALPFVHEDDHPHEDLMAGQYRISLPQSLETFARQLWPQAQRLEWCLRGRDIVLRRGWAALDAACTATPEDTVYLLDK